MREPENASAAREHIALIRTSKGLSGDGRDDPGDLGPNVADLEASLNYLSDDIYNSCTHFLLELIQNADDNFYDNIEPTLDLTLDGNTLRVDCNERGFMRRNVDAICRVRASTKRQADSGVQFIGEKGIGFKSVFQAATIVWVSSRHYSFKFDKNRRLGMIAPIWENLPLAPRAGFTTFLLRLDETYDVTSLRRELQSLDSRLLVFLRQLRRIHVNVVENGGERITKKLTRSDIQDDLGSIVRLSENGEISDYMVLPYVTSGLPDVEKRSGMTESTILLAFPLDEVGEPSIANQKVYSFLPIRDFGLRFLLHADFLLTTSREDIDTSSEWNTKLLDGCVDAFMYAVESLRTSPLRYNWVRYLPSKSLRGNFFDLFSTALFQRLYDSHILEDSTGMLRTPKELAYTPPPYQNDSGCPLIPLAQIGGYDLAPEYESEDLDQFKALDVHFVTDEVFLDNLDIFLQKQSDCFREYESVWHAKIAEVLIPLVHAKYIDRLQSLELIPLSDGTWTRANNGQFFFDTADDGWPVPDGLSLSIVEVEAAADPTRHTLFTLLGAIQLGTSAIWNRIIKLHDSAAHIGDDMSRAALLSQIGFLFLSDWQFRHNHKLWVETDTGARVPGNVLYRDSQEPYSASHFFGQEHRSKFIHPDFTSAFPDRSQEWLVWLRDNVGIESTPRIVSESPGSSFTMHPDLELIVDSMDPLDVLLFLREYWDQIAHWIVTQDLEDTYSDAEHSRRQIRTKIGRMKVKCTNGKLVELSRTTLSLSDDSTGDYLIQSTLDIPDRDDPRWKFLRHFGAGRKRSLRTYIDSLEELSGHEASLDQVLYILEQIERCCSEDERSVRDLFRTKPVIFIPPAHGCTFQWRMLSECIWDGPEFLRETKILKQTYSSCEHLLCKVLGIQNASIEHFIREAKNIKSGDQLEYIGNVFLELESWLDKAATSEKVHSLRMMQIWPIRSKGSSSSYDYLGVGEQRAVNWYIADRAHLATAFESKVSLLAFSVDDVARMEKLLQALAKTPSRLLTAVTKSFASTSAHLEPKEDFARMLRGKASFILRLIPRKELHSMSHWPKLLRTVQVFTCEEVTQEWSLQCSNGDKIIGLPVPGHAALVEANDSLRIILSRKTFGNLLSRHELSEKLCEFFKIPGVRISHLSDILSEDNHNTLTGLLERYGIPKLDSKFEDHSAPPVTSKNEGHKSQGKEDNTEKRKARNGSGKADKQSASNTNFNRSSKSAPKRSQILLVEGVFDEDDHVHITRHVGHSGCKPDGKSTTGIIQEQGATLFAKSLRKILLPELTDKDTVAQDLVNNGVKVQAAAFEFQDKLGRFTDFLIKMKCSIALSWTSKPYKYHIVVKSTTGDLYSEFSLENEEFKLARRYSALNNNSESPENVFLIVRLYNIEQKNGFALYNDPWLQYMDGELQIEAHGRYRCKAVK